MRIGTNGRQVSALEHFFCSKCGIYTHHQRRSNPNQYGVNVACLSGLSPFDFEDVVVYDGANHPADAYFSKPRVAGHLKFITEPAEKLIDIPEPDSLGG